jgi:CheY-specific phosphatase CheX
MKIEYINPFIESVTDLLGTRLGSDVERGDVGVTKCGMANTLDVLALIDISGPARGTVAITMPSDTAIGIVEALLGSTCDEVDETVSDGVAEVVNMIAGGAKAKIATSAGVPLNLSLPTVVTGKENVVDHLSESTWVQVPFKTGLGEFDLQVTLESDDE